MESSWLRPSTRCELDDTGFDLSGQSLESHVDVPVCLGGGLQVSDAIVSCHLTGLLHRDLSLVSQIALVANEQLLDGALLLRDVVLVGLLHPAVHSVE